MSHWAPASTTADYEAAICYLTLVTRADIAQSIVEALRVAPETHYEAKDLLRASRLPLLPKDDPHVARDLKKIKRGAPLSPVLLVRGETVLFDRALIVADGYHRICANIHAGDDEEVACRIVDPPRDNSASAP